MEGAYINLDVVRACGGHPETLALFVHILAAMHGGDWAQDGQTLPRGQVQVTRDSLSRRTGLSQQQVRTALARLQRAGLLKCESSRKNTLLTCDQYDELVIVIRVDSQAHVQSQPTERPKSTNETSKVNQQNVQSQPTELVDSQGPEVGVRPKSTNGTSKVNQQNVQSQPTKRPKSTNNHPSETTAQEGASKVNQQNVQSQPTELVGSQGLEVGARPKSTNETSKVNQPHANSPLSLVVDDIYNNNIPEEGKEGAQARTRETTLEERKAAFYRRLVPFVQSHGGKYSKEMVRDFFDYWTESNEGGRKMRFEMEKVFSVERRLRTWAGRQKAYEVEGPRPKSRWDLDPNEEWER